MSRAASAGEETYAPTRRDFVAGAGAVLGLCAVGGIGVATAGDELLRPPGGQSESAFIARCTRCDRCRSICPTGVIAPANLEDGLVNIRTPKLNFKLGWCDFCGKCASVCATGAISNQRGEAFTAEGFSDRTFYETGAQLGVAHINEERCIIWSGQSTCKLCSQYCPYGAITLDELERPVIDANLCTGCGVCEYNCPSSRLLSYEGDKTRGIEVGRA